MANSKHYAMLKLGIKVWNTWRKENHGPKVDLSSAILQGADLSDLEIIPEICVSEDS